MVNGICNTLLDALGNTPLVRLQRMGEKDAAQILVKFEGLNIGGSIKSRTAYHMICRAEEAGDLHPDSIIVEPTSGNQGVGLAMVGAIRGYRTIIIMPDSVSRERSMLVRHYGAEVIFCARRGRYRRLYCTVCRACRTNGARRSQSLYSAAI